MATQGAAHHLCVCVASVGPPEFPLHFDLGEGNGNGNDYTDKKKIKWTINTPGTCSKPLNDNNKKNRNHTKDERISVNFFISIES